MGRESNPLEDTLADIQLCNGLWLQSASLVSIPVGILEADHPTAQLRPASGEQEEPGWTNKVN